MKKVLIVLLILLLLTAIPVTVFFVQRQQEIRSKAAPATTLSLRPATVTKNIGETVSFDIVIDTGDNNAFYAAIELQYDPAKLEAESIVNGPIFPNVESPGVVDPAGKVAIGAGVSNSAEPFNGTGIAATVRFKTLAATTGQTNIQFTEQTAVGGTDEGTAKNILIGSTPAKVTIIGMGASPTPTQGAAATPTPTGGAGAPTPTPTGDEDEDATLSPTLTPTPTDADDEDDDGEQAASVSILSPTETDGAVSATPVIRGKAPPLSTITITIYSEPQTAVVTADDNGDWSYTPTEALAPGPHDLVVMATASDGTTYNTTESFVVAGATGDQDDTAIPQSGNSVPTLILILFGIALLSGGVLLNVAYRKNEYIE